MTNTLNILIGAGFSYNAGLPLASDIKGKFDQPLFEKLLKAGSSEWMWVETQDEAMINNGRLGSDHMEYAFILEEIVKDYKAANNDAFVDYEDFFQYVQDKISKEGWFENIIRLAADRFYIETDFKNKNSEYYGFAFRNPERHRPLEIINYLISDLLYIRIPDEELIKKYEVFIGYIQKYKTVNIFSLNHDIVLERLFRLVGIQYSDGFTELNSHLHHDGNPQRIFRNVFGSSVRLVKLHGSIDMYQFQHGKEEGSVLTPTGDYTYFKPDNYRAKHYVRRVDPLNGNTVQNVNLDIVPKFITGKNKRVMISADYMYKEIHSFFQKEMASKSDLLIVGYSFGDPHINDELKKFTKKEGPKVINLNYRDTFPFDAPNVKEINTFDQLIST